MPNYEELSVNGVGIPRGAKNKDLAKRFLKFFAEKENNLAFAKGGAVLPARIDVTITDDPYAAEQFAHAKGAKGSSQFYDRDTDPDMAQVGMRGFQEFLQQPDRVEAVLERLDEARKRIFK
jgi:multiple sugar transport system substrate-binding protein